LNFHAGILLYKISVGSKPLYGICLWDNNYLFVGSDKTIELIDIENKKVIKNLEGHNNIVLTLKKFDLPQYGRC